VSRPVAVSRADDVGDPSVACTGAGWRTDGREKRRLSDGRLEFCRRWGSRRRNLQNLDS
jgi:hypothetical protein